MKKRILIFGNTNFTKEVLRTIYETGEYEVGGWTGNDFSQNKTAKVNPVIEFCKEKNLPLFSFDKNKHLKESDRYEEFKSFKPDLCVVMAYGKIISKNFLDLPDFGFINIHPSLLPDLRGATPIQSALFKGYKNTGCTIQKMSEKMDEGDILKQYQVNIELQDNFVTLREKIIRLVCDDFSNLLKRYLDNEINPIKQEDSKATYCYTSDFTREKGLIDWNSSCYEIHNKIRSFFPEPVAWTLFEEKKLNINLSFPSEIKSKENPGMLFFKDKKLFVSTRDFDLEIIEVVLEGKKAMSGKDFGNGRVRENKIHLG